MRRRTFLRSAVTAAALGSALVPRFSTSAWAAPDPQLGRLAMLDPSSERIVVIMRMFGGNDGVNTIIPFHDDEYYRIRKSAYADLTIPAEKTLPIAGLDGYGFHPVLGNLKTLFDEGKVAIVHGVGYPNMDLSHFRGTDIWLSASDWNAYSESGWTARFMEQRYPDYPRVLPQSPIVLEMGAISGILQQGHHYNIGHNYERPTSALISPYSKVAEADTASVLYNSMSQLLTQGNVFNKSIAEALAQAPTPLVTGYSTDEATGPALSTIARMIRGGLKTQIYVFHGGDFDTHHKQQEQHPYQLSRLFDNVYAFQREMEAAGLQDKVVVVPLSEFGRRLEPSFAGTDHGTAGPMFVIGSKVRGGHFGKPPSLRELDKNSNLLWDIDFRQVYSSILSQWFLSSSDHLEASMFGRTYQQLPIFTELANTTSTLETADSNRTTVWPNPASDRVTIHHGDIGATVRAHITRIDGMDVGTSTIASLNGTSELSVHALAPGSYVVQIGGTTNTSWHKVIVSR